MARVAGNAEPLFKKAVRGVIGQCLDGSYELSMMILSGFILSGGGCRRIRRHYNRS